jgi:hypothetical protein
MALLVIDWRPGARKLRVFGAAAAIVAGGVGLRLHTAALPTGALIAWSIAAACAGLAIARPALLRPLHLAITVAALPIGYAVSYAALGALYFGVFLPIGLALRFAGRDALGRRRDPAAATYWQPRPAAPRDRYFRLY